MERLAQTEAALADRDQQVGALTAGRQSDRAQAQAVEEEHSKKLAAARCALFLRLLLL